MTAMPSHYKPIRSFVRREGRMTVRQQRALTQQWPLYGIDYHAVSIDWSSVFGRTAKTVVEIGFGMGESLLSMAERHPDVNFLGIEVHRPGVGALLASCADRQITNIRVMTHDALDVLSHCLPASSVDTVQLFFPDPWHKKRHHKRRIVQERFLGLVRQALKPQGLFHVATDWAPYADSIQEIMVRTAGFYRADLSQHRWPLYRCETKFEQRGLRLGHVIWDGVYERTVDVR